jgi:hypothetical protein
MRGLNPHYYYRSMGGLYGSEYQLSSVASPVQCAVSLCSLKPLPGVAISSTIPQRVEPALRYKAIVAMDGASGSHSLWGNASRDLLAGLARFRSPEFEALLTGFIGIATRLRNEFERILDEARRSRFFQDLERMRSGPPVPGYEAFLIDEGYEPFEARLMGHAVNNLGKRLVKEREAERTLAGVLRAVIKGGRKRTAGRRASREGVTR